MSREAGHDGSRLTGGGLLARNAAINLVGQLLPVLVAVFAVPLLIGDMGSDRFGVLALAWIVTSYFSLFDFGLGRATTKFVAEYQARDQVEELPELIWSSTVFHVCLGLIGGSVFALLTPWLSQRILNVPPNLMSETTTSFYLLAVSVPLVVTTAALRGVLEALQRFDMINAIKIPASVINYLGPLPVLVFVDSLVAVVGLLVVSRGVVLVAHFLLTLRALPSLSSGFRFSAARMKPLVGFGGWLTVSGFVYPSMVAVDRFMIGALVSLSAVTLYVTPYEVVTKLTLFSASLLSVLFPAFSALAVSREQRLRRLYDRAIKCIVALVAPIVGVLLAFAFELLSVWIAPEFAEGSAPIARWLSIGVLFSILSHPPLTVLQGIGRADLTAKLQIVQLPVYVVLIWYMASNMGAVGVAIGWTIRSAVDAIILLVTADRMLPASEGEGGHGFGWSPPIVISIFLLLFLGAGLLPLGVKILASVLLLGVFVLWEWLFFLRMADRELFLAELEPILNKFR